MLALNLKMDGSKNNPEKSSTTKINEHILSGLSVSKLLSFKDIGNKHDVYRGKTGWKKFVDL